MKQIVILFLILSAPSKTSADSKIDEIYEYYSQGDFDKARREFQLLPQSAIRDGNRLFLNSLFEISGPQARELLEAALRSDLDGKYAEEANFRLIELDEAMGDTTAVISLSTAFLNRWEMSRYREQLLAMLAVHSKKGGSEQKRYYDLLIDEFPGAYFGQYARLFKARQAFDKSQYKTASQFCRQISEASNDDLVPESLILLSKIALKSNNAERALFNYSIMREQYQHAIGQDELVSALKKVSERQSGDESIEVFEGLTYSVQVGVFAEKDNAKRMAKRVKAYGYKDIITKRRFSGKHYYYVLAGEFATMKQAQVAKDKLEMGENGIFKVVVNDEK
jgi:tetratricopeptide (TPR) repeat protein